jgi:hypothetical protein
MRFSQQFHRYRKQFGREPPYPATGVTCYWMRRRMGTIGERTDIVLSPAACRHFRICAAQPLDRFRAARIAAWMARQEAV